MKKTSLLKKLFSYEFDAIMNDLVNTTQSQKENPIKLPTSIKTRDILLKSESGKDLTSSKHWCIPSIESEKSLMVASAILQNSTRS